MKQLVLCFLVGLPFYMNAQLADDSVISDSRYLEDQFYVGITYNFLFNRPEGVDQRNLSYGLQAGFIKDIPLNYNRNFAVGIGLGLALNTYYSTLLATETTDGISYRILGGDDSFKRNKIETHLVEMPFELRWRTSTASEYKFWRIYAGVKLGYVIGARSKFVSNELKASFFNTDVRDFQYGITFNFGFNTFNIHTYYSLKELFNDTVSVNGQAVNIQPLRVGLVFYIL